MFSLNDLWQTFLTGGVGASNRLSITVAITLAGSVTYVAVEQMT